MGQHSPPFTVVSARVWQEPTNRASFRVEYVLKYANKEAADDAGEESADDDDMSSVASFGDDDGDDEEPAGKMDEV